jgi:hypothetical protein
MKIIRHFEMYLDKSCIKSVYLKIYLLHFLFRTVSRKENMPSGRTQLLFYADTVFLPCVRACVCVRARHFKGNINFCLSYSVSRHFVTTYIIQKILIGTINVSMFVLNLLPINLLAFFGDSYYVKLICISHSQLTPHLNVHTDVFHFKYLKYIHVFHSL